MASNAEISPRAYARAAGFLYLVVIVGGVWLLVRGVNATAWRARRAAHVLVAAALVVLAACGTVARDPVPPAAGSNAGNSFVVRDVRVFDGERLIDRATVVVRAGRIVSVGPGAPPADLPAIDGVGRTLLPGLIDTHAHVTTETGMRNALRFGVTTLLDMFTAVDFMAAHRTQRDRLTRTELADLYSAGAPVTSPGGLGTQFGMTFPTITGPAEATRFVRDRIAEGSAYIKVLYEPDAGIMPSISRDTLAAVVAAAHAQGVLAVAHVSSHRGAREAVRAGADGLAHVFSDEVIDDTLVHELAARHVFVTATLSIFAAIDGAGVGPTLAADPRLAPWLSEKQRAALNGPPPGPDDPLGPYLRRFHIATALANVQRLHAAGVTVLAGDDAPNLAALGVSLHGELELLTRAGLTPAEALAAATRLPAERFRLSDRGRIAPGARADLVLVDGNPLADITATRAIAHVFKNGFDVARTPPP
jgi:imidazolonepropionase-like amidohydrolase